MPTSVVQKRRSLKAALGLPSVEMTVILALFMIALFALAYLIRKVIVLHQTGFDKSVSAFLNNYISPQANDVMLFFTFFGHTQVFNPGQLGTHCVFSFGQKK